MSAFDNEGSRLDPTDWDLFDKEMHRALDVCLKRMRDARSLPWQPKPDTMRNSISLLGLDEGTPTGAIYDQIASDIMPYATGNTHPRFFGWVHGTGLPVAVGAEMFAATMNSNCGGRDHGAVEEERAVIEWLVGVSGLPSNTAFGILTGGTSQATVLALSAARVKLLGAEVRQTGLRALPAVRVYAAEGAHTCIRKALEVMGHGGDALRDVRVGESGQMDIQALVEAVEEDRAAGVLPLAVVGTAGSVNVGVFDPLRAIGEYCREQGVWFHVDAAFGFWVLLADEPYRGLIAGLELADSMDFHKWASVPYQCGACLVRSGETLRTAFSMRPIYLAGQARGLAGGDLWFCDYGMDLSRGFSALKVWASLKSCGVRALGQAITDNCQQASYMGELVTRSSMLVLCHIVVSNVCCFRPLADDSSLLGKAVAAGVDVVGEVAASLQLRGEAVFSTTVIRGHGKCFRACIVNHRTTREDIEVAVRAVEMALQAFHQA